MHVGMEHPVAHRHPEEGADHRLAECAHVVPGGPDLLDMAERDAVDPGRRHDALRGARPVDSGHDEAGFLGLVARHVLRDLGGRARLHPEVTFLGERRAERGDDGLRPQAARRGKEHLDEPGGLGEGADVAIELAFDAGPQDLHRNVLRRAGQPRPVDLRDRGGRDRRIEALEEPGEWRAELGLQNRDGLRLREGRQPIAQRFQLGRDLRADEVGPRGQELAELDIGRAELLQCPRHAQRPGGVAVPPALEEPCDAHTEGRPGRHFGRVEPGEHALARHAMAGPRQPDERTIGGDHERAGAARVTSELPAGMDRRDAARKVGVADLGEAGLPDHIGERLLIRESGGSIQRGIGRSRYPWRRAGPCGG